MRSILVAAVFIAWFIGSAVAQVRVDRIQSLRRWDVIGLLPGWNFFAPHPITADLLVQLRVLTNADLSDWRLLDVPLNRRPLDWLLNLRRRERKAAFESCVALLYVFRNATQPSQVILSAPYLLLLGAATRGAEAVGVGPVQFRVAYVAREGGREVFLSEFHRVPDGDFDSTS